MSFWSELKRRNVVKVGIAYAIVAWLLIQGADIVSPHLRLPEWTVPLVIILLSIGFPIALILAWAFELTPDGIKLTKEVARAESITRLTGRKLNYILAGLLVLSIAFLLFDNYYLDRRAVETERAPVVGEEEEAPKTIAVLPFVNRSSEKDQEYFVDGLTDEIITMLSQISGLQVTSTTSSFLFKDPDKSTQEIASVLGVEHILEGSVRKAGNALRISAQLIRAKDDYHLWSKAYDRELKDIFDVQEDIATAVADELKATLGIGHSFKQLGGTDNVEAYELYLIAQGRLNDEGTYTMTCRALESIDKAIALDPDYALAWARKAIVYSFMAILDPDSSRIASELEAGIGAAHRAIELEPNLSGGYASLGQNRYFSADWIEAELAFRKAFEITTEPVSVLAPAIPCYYLAVGYLEKAREFFEEVRREDPFNFPNRGWYVLCLGDLGHTQQAELEYERVRALFGDQWDWGDLRITIVRLGSGDEVSLDDIVYSDPIFDTAREHLESPEEGLEALRRLYVDNTLSSGQWGQWIWISMWAAYFGDPEFAMDAMEKYFNLQPADTLWLWSKVLQEVRSMPRFKKLVREIGLVDYWNEFGWPNICHPTDNGNFECD